MFEYIIFEKLYTMINSQKINLFIHKKLKELITMFILVVRLHFFNFYIKLSFDLEIESCKNINDFILNEYSFNSHIISKVICEDDKIAALIF